MEQQLKQHSIAYKILESVPFLGKALTLIIDHAQDAIAEHGFLFGSVKGLLVGIIIAVVMISSIEAVTAVFEVIREEVRLRWTYGMMAERRQAADERGIEETRRYAIHRSARSETIRHDTEFYAVDKQGDAHLVDGLTPKGLLEFLDRFQRNASGFNTTEALPTGASVTPFYFNYGRDVATVHLPDKEECAVAEFESNIILIPLAAYKASGLPMKGDVHHEDK